ncbi:MAG: hypothetical protein ACKPKO_03235, partial [Candidatus Fonsibacter sp.]
MVASQDSIAKFGGDSSSSERAAIALPSVEVGARITGGEVPIAYDDELGGTVMVPNLTTELLALEMSSSVAFERGADERPEAREDATAGVGGRHWASPE